jgi:hypothetical protein
LSTISEIQSYITSQEFAFREEFLAQVKKLKSEKSRQIVLGFLEAGRIDLVLQYIEDQNKTWIPWLHDVYLSSVKLEQKDYIFNPTEEETNSNLASTIAAILLLLTNNQKTLFYRIWEDGYISGKSSAEIVKEWQKYVGLTETQYQRLKKFEKQLKERQAQDRQARDDGEETTPLTDKELSLIVDGRQNQMLDSRADMDSRDVVSQITDAGRLAVLNQMMADDPELEVEKEWRSRRDDRVRFTHDIHTGLDGQIRPLNGHFNSPSGARLFKPHDPAAPLSETAGCRCFLIYRLKYNAI